jgi:glycosyltransferase involved in cell wall biosynthesis
MLKVMHLVTSLDTGGAEIMLSKLVTNMDESKCKSVVVSMLDKGTIGSRIEELGIQVYTLNMKRGIPNISSILKLCRIIRETRPDIMQTWLYHADLLGLIAARLCKINSLIWNIRCSYMDLSKYSIITKFVLKLLVFFSNQPDAIIINSVAGERLHINMGYKPRRWVEIFNGFEIEKYKVKTAEEKDSIRKRLGLEDEVLIAGMVARYDPMKGHELLLDAMDRVINIEKINNMRILLIGKNINWKNPDLAKKISLYKLEDKVILLEERNDIAELLPVLDMYISPSVGEGFPNIVGEAMCCGIPCIVTDVGDSARLINGFGTVVRPNDAELLKKAIIQMIDIGDSKRNEIGLNGRRHIIENYDIIKITKQYEDLYSKIGTN